MSITWGNRSPERGSADPTGTLPISTERGLEALTTSLPAWEPGTLGHIPLLNPCPWFPVLTVLVSSPLPPQRCMA